MISPSCQVNIPLLIRRVGEVQRIVGGVYEIGLELWVSGWRLLDSHQSCRRNHRFTGDGRSAATRLDCSSEVSVL